MVKKAEKGAGDFFKKPMDNSLIFQTLIASWKSRSVEAEIKFVLLTVQEYIVETKKEEQTSVRTKEGQEQMLMVRTDGPSFKDKDMKSI